MPWRVPPWLRQIMTRLLRSGRRQRATEIRQGIEALQAQEHQEAAMQAYLHHLLASRGEVERLAHLQRVIEREAIRRQRRERGC